MVARLHEKIKDELRLNVRDPYATNAKMDSKKSIAAADMADMTRPSRKAKKEDAPKINLSAYQIFSKHIRPSVKEENPEASFGDISCIIDAEFKALDANELKEYYEEAAADRARYQHEKEDYDSNNTFAADDDDMTRPSREAKKEADRAKKIKIALRKTRPSREAKKETNRAKKIAKKEDKRAKKIAIALRKAAAETASNNSMEIKVDKIIKKFYQFYKDYENEEYNRVKAKVSDLCGPRSRICAPYQRISI